MKSKKEIYNHALDSDEKTLEQFKNCYTESFVVKAALMPDAHMGYVAPIGAVLITKDYVVPSWVGYDIGCGMTAVKLKSKNLLEDIKKNTKKIYAQVNRDIPMGLGQINKPNSISVEGSKQFDSLIEKFKKGAHSKSILQFLESGKAERHIGSLGHGNHFIELAVSKDKLIKSIDEAWIVIHSGSRGIGHKVATEYMKKSSGKTKDFEETHPLKIDSQLGKEYLNVLEFGLEFALLNRMEMIRKIIKSLEHSLEKNIKWELVVNKNHNHAIKEKWVPGLYVHRKGATPAKKDELGVIPANMRDGSFLVKGKGNKQFLKSSSHGAGRAMSRKEAREKISLEQFKKNMEGIQGTISNATLDEAPSAYKNIYDVMEAQKESVSEIDHLIPLINWKGGDKHRIRKEKGKYK
jgi:tRNA-splicing ligase RtcB (3'-phosphate/5'-hydroxy nucleic acid ligase)